MKEIVQDENIVAVHKNTLSLPVKCKTAVDATHFETCASVHKSTALKCSKNKLKKKE